MELKYLHVKFRNQNYNLSSLGNSNYMYIISTFGNPVNHVEFEKP